MRVWSEKPGRKEEKGKRDVNGGTSIEMALNWAYIASQYKYDTSVPVVFSTSVSLAVGLCRDCPSEGLHRLVTRRRDGRLGQGIHRREMQDDVSCSSTVTSRMLDGGNR